ncbi:proteasome regulatory particle lid subunit RPN12 [Sugiyamaella lignohabitans]|uniref:Proteasome regulatory particle lid subunit RPN12 n=1 Tax=Sugiyamaella lignohabitans TaxID=796027 RepID=A0A167E0H9_9ASCO|nr:proteasome regulatory particle lid subunit RPN12 [Sugiyamaella lignohabitans]ANB13502.1 proteasome regulatory particle lid subunit RPN12 [Sugiyamaella lignohabitans]
MSLQQLGIEFVEAFQNADYTKTSTILPKIKIELARAGLMVPTNASSKQDLLAARQVLELGVLACIHNRDEDELNRLVAQIRPFYSKELGLPRSENENKLNGLYLLLLVSKNEIAEFHTELETLENAENDEYLAYPIRLERWLMEGSYDKVWKAITQKSQFPSPEFAILAESLVYTVRSEISVCVASAYESLPLSNARHLLFFSTNQEIIDFVHEQPGWELHDGRISFTKAAAAADGDYMDDGSAINGENSTTERLIANTLGYAQQIETII